VYAQVYYEAKSVNTQLTYRYKQLEKVKETLEEAWIAHKELHQAAGLAVSEDHSSLVHTHDVFRTSVSQSTNVRKLSFGGYTPLLRPLQTDDTVMHSAPKSSGKLCTTKQHRATGDVCMASNHQPFIVVLDSLSSRGQDYTRPASNRPSYYSELIDCGSNDRWIAKQNSDVPDGDQLMTSLPELPSAFHCTDIETMSAIFNSDHSSAAQSTLHADD